MLRKLLTILGAVLIVAAGGAVTAGMIEGSPEVEIWTDRGDGAVYSPGDNIEVFIRPTHDCYVIVYEIDSDGYLRVLFPYDCSDDGYVVGGRVYRIGQGPYSRYYVTGPKGVEYVHAVSSFRPFRKVYWDGCSGYEDYAYDVTWNGFADYWGCALPPRIYGDPYIAMQTIDEFICLDAIEAGMVYADFTHFYVEARVDYPRYVCYDCHGYNTWIRPYAHVCTGFSISFVACDPCYSPWSWWWWRSPTRVYCGPRYVCYCRKPCKDYPSVYKWKTRDEWRRDGRDNGRDWVDEVKWKARVEDPRGVEVVRTRDAAAIDGVRVKPKAKGDLDLYSRRDIVRPADRIKKRSDEIRKVVEDKKASRQTDRNAVVVPRVTADKIKQATRINREIPAKPEPKPGERPQPVRVKETTKKDRPAEPERSQTQVKRQAKPQLRSQPSRDTKQHSKQKVAPRVRKSKGESPATRRRVSS